MTGARQACASVVALGYLPPSLNQLLYRHWTVQRREKQRLQNDLGMVLLAGKVPRPIPGGHVEATAVLLVPDRRRRDVDNFRSVLSKCLGDALVSGGWLADDAPQYFTFDELRFDLVPKVRATRITLTWTERDLEAGETPVSPPTIANDVQVSTPRHLPDEVTGQGRVDVSTPAEVTGQGREDVPGQP